MTKACGTSVINTLCIENNTDYLVFYMTQERPFDLINKSIGQQVMIRLKNGIDIRGKVVSFDAHMNIVIENAEELHEGNLRAKLGTILLRGGNIIFLSPV